MRSPGDLMSGDNGSVAGRAVIDFLRQPYRITLSDGRKATTTTVARLAELVIRNQGDLPKIWSGIAVQDGIFVGLTPGESIEMATLRGFIDGIGYGRGNPEEELLPCSELMKGALQVAEEKLRAAAAKAAIWRPGQS